MAKQYDVIIVDDEESARNILSNLILRFHPQLNVVATCEELSQAVHKIEKYNPQLVFLDIEMPNYAGYEITSFFKKIDFEIIFITAYDHYAVKAFEVAAVDYLLKPIEIERLSEAIERFTNRVDNKDAAINYQVLQESLTSNTMKKIIVPTLGGQKSIEIEQIISIEAQESYSEINTLDNQKFILSKNLKHFESLFENNKTLFRTHKSWMINLNLIKKFSFIKMEIEMNNGTIVKLSKYRKQEFIERINE